MTAPRRAWRWGLALAGLLAVGAAAVVARELRPGEGATLDEGRGAADTAAVRVRWEPDSLRVAVLRLGVPPSADSLRYLAWGLNRDMTEALRRREPVTVVPLTAVRAVEQGRVQVDSMVRELGVALYVEGALEQSGPRRRISFRLVDAATGNTISHHDVSRPAGEPLELRNAAVAELEAGLEAALGVILWTPIGTQQDRTTGPAWILVQRAAGVVERALDRDGLGRPENPASARRALARADSLLARAEAQAPGWIEPILARGWLEHARARYATDEPDALEATPLLRGLGHAERALVLRPGDRPSTLELRGLLRLGLANTMDHGGGRTRMLRLARQDLTEAVELRPSMARAWLGLEEVLRAEGAREAAERAARRALLEDPYLEQGPRLYGRLFRATLETGRHEAASRWCESGRRRFPRDPELALCRLLLEISTDSLRPDPAAAHRAVDTALALASPADTPLMRDFTSLQLAKVFALAGRRDSAEAYLGGVRGETFRPALAYEEAHARLLLGQPESALALLQATLAADPERARSWPRDPWLRELWTDPRFLRLMETAGD